MSKLPGYVHYPDKWIAATFSMDAQTYRAYHLILNWMWLHGPGQCSIPNDPEILSAATNLRGAKLRKVIEKIQNPISPLLKVENSLLVSSGLRKEAERQAQISEQRRLAAERRWSDDPCKSNANASAPHASRNAPKTKAKEREGIEVSKPSTESDYKTALSTLGLGGFTTASEIVKRIESVTNEPEWSPWWAVVVQRLIDACQISHLEQAIIYVEQTQDPETRRVKGIGELDRPGGYLVLKAQALCKDARLRWPDFPRKAKKS